MPALTWDFTDQKPNMKLEVQSKERPKKVLLWTAKSKTRDFRQSHWSAVELNKLANSEENHTVEKERASNYVHTENVPKNGFSAFYLEAVYERSNVPVFLSTNVRILKAARNEK